MSKRILIANRGEIALRIARACVALGHVPVAVFSDADRDSSTRRHVAESHYIGGAPAAQSYLNTAKIIEVALKEKCDAVHPGYGFLSENSIFAEEVEKAGLIFIGPEPAHIRVLGDKLEALHLARESGIPTLPSSTGNASDSELLNFSRQQQFPYIIKAAAGGGGRGMRVVHTEEELKSALGIARAEALKFFSNDTVYLERYLPSPRHIEVQVFGDGKGNGYHFFTRDCSVQRRHQKVIEEAPAPFIDSETHQALCEAALSLVKKISYRNAGTVEFLLTPDGEFFFLEMNTRIQVEHPVTELVTGIDLIQLQILLAFTGEIPEEYQSPHLTGHAIELRLIAEDPEKGFAPQTGMLKSIELSKIFDRCDMGYDNGDEVSLYYDSLIGKLMVHAPTRALALERARSAVRTSRVVGIQTNLEFFSWLLCQNDFLRGAVPITYLERALPENFSNKDSANLDTYGNWLAADDTSEVSESFAVTSFSGLQVSVEVRHLKDGTFLAVPRDENGSHFSRNYWRLSNCKRSLLREMKQVISRALANTEV